jgi:hypothetical protein
MRWLSGRHLLVLGLVAAMSGCGSGSGDDLILSFIGFSAGNLTQPDAVSMNSADVDVCQGVCVSGSQITVEPFAQTRVIATFMNNERANITLDQYTISAPGSGIPDQTYNISALIPGGRCAADQSKQCATDSDCAGVCTHSETDVDILLYDFVFKSLVVDGECPSVDNPAGSVIPRTLGVNITFSGEDDTQDRFTVHTQYISTFADFDSCSTQG